MKVLDLFSRILFMAFLTAGLGVLASGQAAADIDAVVMKAIEAKAIPGAGVAVVRDGKAVFTKGYGLADIDAGTPVTERTAFQIASVTKQFTAVGVMLLAEKGKVKLDDPLGKYVPEAPAKWSVVTIRQLLNQTSGIPNYNEGERLNGDKVYTKAEIIDLMRDVPMTSEPGTRWEYSNTNYFLLGMVIEKASGKPYADYMRQRVFKPLGMNSTLVNAKGVVVKNAASGYSPSKGKWERTEIGDPGLPFAAGAIVSTPADMARWAIAVSDGKLLKKTSWDEIFASGKTADGKQTNYGFGWYLAKFGDTPYVFHSGGIAGFGAYHMRFPADNLSVVVMTNTSGASTRIANDIAGLYLPKVAAVIAEEAKARDAARNAQPIEDTDPETTKFLRGVFEGFLRGEGDPALFSAEMQKLLFPDRIKQLKGPLGSQGPIKAFELLSAENKGGTKARRYRITFESGMKVRGDFVIDAEGKISTAGFGRQ
jgi:CubicO group peptidase (beta-lactamase class C family)